MPLLIIMVVIILTLIFILSLILIYLVIRRKREVHYKREIRNYISERQQQWFEYLVEGQELMSSIIPKTPFEKDATDIVLVRYANNLSGSDMMKRMIHFTSLYMEEYYREQLMSRRWSIQVNVLHKIIDFRMGFLVKDVNKILESDRKYTRNQYLLMYKILAMFEPKKFMNYLLNPHVPLGEYDYRRLLLSLEDDQISHIMKRFDETPTYMQYVFIELLGMQHNIQAIDFLEKLIVQGDDELRIRALKAVAAIGYPSSIDIYKPLVHAKNWVERLMVAKVLVHFVEEQALDLLITLLEDPAWEVRAQAANSLQSIRDGIPKLKQFMTSSEDEYAKTMVKEVLGKEAFV